MIKKILFNIFDQEAKEGARMREREKERKINKFQFD